MLPLIRLHDGSGLYSSISGIIGRPCLVRTVVDGLLCSKHAFTVVKSCKFSAAQADITFLALTKTPGEYLVPPDRSWFSEPIKICDLKLRQYIQGRNVSRLPSRLQIYVLKCTIESIKVSFGSPLLITLYIFILDMSLSHKLVLPDLVSTCPFNWSSHPDYERARKESSAWVESFKSLQIASAGSLVSIMPSFLLPSRTRTQVTKSSGRVVIL